MSWLLYYFVPFGSKASETSHSVWQASCSQCPPQSSGDPPALGSVEMSSNPEDLVSSKPECKRSEPDAAVETAAKTEGPNAVAMAESETDGSVSDSANDPVNKADVTASKPVISETAGKGSGSAIAGIVRKKTKVVNDNKADSTLLYCWDCSEESQVPGLD